MLLVALVPGASAKNAPQIVVMCMGAKPANLDEALFPHIKFYLSGKFSSPAVLSSLEKVYYAYTPAREK